jgi:CheY-like chemotaxis protein
LEAAHKRPSFLSLPRFDMPSILVIEDDHAVLAAIDDALSDAGYAVTTASNGLEGFRRYRDEPCDVVVTDLAMPEQDGFETIAGIKREFPAARIVAISEAGSGIALGVAKALGADETMEKPIRPDRLRSVIDSLISRV